MKNISNTLGGSAEKILRQLQDMQSEARSLKQEGPPADGKSFMEHLKDGVNEVNAKSVKADRMGTDLSTGKSENIHETMIAATQAELSFNLMVQLRNKGLEAYNEIMRMPV